MSGSPHKKVAIVTGATKGIGHAIVSQFLKRKDWAVVATGRQLGVWRSGSRSPPP